jgi:hypothetical protein
MRGAARRCLMAGGLAAIVMLRTGPLVAAVQPLDVQLSQSFATAPASVLVTIYVEQDPRNRALRIEADGDQMFTSSDVVLEGEREKRVHSVRLKGLAAGAYRVTVELLSADGVRASAVRTLLVGGH